MRRWIVSGVMAASVAAPRAGAQLSSAELFVDIDAGVSATDMNIPTDGDSFSDGPRTSDIFLGSGSIPWDVQAAAGAGSATSVGQIQYLATTTSQIYARGDFEFITSVGGDAAALGGFDAGVSIRFQVAIETPYTITGFVSTAQALDGPQVVSCQINGTILAGDTRATPLAAGTYLIDAQRTLFPGETAVLECSAAASGGQNDANTLAWEVTVNGLPEPGPALATLTGVGTIAALARRRRPARAGSRAGCG